MRESDGTALRASATDAEQASGARPASDAGEASATRTRAGGEDAEGTPAEKDGDPRSVRRVHGLELRIDRTLCVGFGDCIAPAPEAFALDEEGIAILLEPEAVPRERLLEACSACPVDAITACDAEGRQVAP